MARYALSLFILAAQAVVRRPLILEQQEIHSEAYPSIVDADESGSGHLTPAQDRVPLFSYECCSLPSDDEPEENNQAPHIEIEKANDDISIDVNDPTLEEFPCDRDLVLEKVRTLETSLDVDHTSFDGTPSSPVVGFNDKGERILDVASPPPSSVLRTPDVSPSLDSILEESGETDDIPSLSRGNSEGGYSQDSNRSSSKKGKEKQSASVLTTDILTKNPPQPLKNVDGVDEEFPRRY